MRRSTKHIFPMLCIIVILAGVLVLFESNPAILQSLPWLAPDEPPAVEPLPPEDQTPEVDPPADEPGGQEPPEDEPPEDDPPAKPTTVVALTGSFYTYEEMKEDMAQLCTYYPDILSYRAYGTSADGRELLCATLGNPAAGKQVIT